MKGFLLFLGEVIKIVILAAIIVLPIRYFVFQPFIVKGQSMEPSFESGNYLIIDQLSYRFREPQRGEVVVFKYPKNPSQRYIKRVIGLPGETVEIKNGKVIIFTEKGTQILDEPDSFFTPGNVKISLNKDEYFVLGDNRSFSSDSRHWGALPKEYIIGRAYLRLWPLTALAKIETPKYR